MISKTRTLFVFVLLGLLCLPMMAADMSSQPELVGRIHSLPPGDLAGGWLVADQVVIVNEYTNLELMNGPFRVSACVAVDGIDLDGSILAKAVGTLPDGECDPLSPKLADDDGDSSFLGHIERMPAGSNYGDWVVSGTVVVVSPSTELEQEHGPFVPGACVEVEGSRGGGGRFFASEIETESPHKCGSTRPGPGPGPDPGPDPGQPTEFKARVEQMPGNGLIGIWKIGGTQVVTSGSTAFDSEDGPFAVGACVEVEGLRGTDGIVQARKLETEESNECGGPGPGPGGSDEFKGQVQEMPAAGLIGNWRIVGRQVTTTESTVFDTEDGPFAVGACVEVEGTRQEGGGIVARKLETEEANECAGGPGPGPGPPPGEATEFKNFVRWIPPTGHEGDWTVGDKTVRVTNATIMEADNGPFTVGSCVEVKGTTDGQVTLAHKMETEEAGDCPPPSPGPGPNPGPGGELDRLVEFLGKAETVPFGFIGDWVIADRKVVATTATEIDMDRGQIVSGSCVEVEGYRRTDGIIEAFEIEAEPEQKCSAPGEGPGVRVKFEDRIDSLPASGLIGDWVIGGRTVGVSESTRLERDNRDFAPGTCVEVKGYAKASGRIDATVVETEDPEDCNRTDDQSEEVLGAAVRKASASEGPAKLTVISNDFRGIIETLPSGGPIGTWFVSGRAVLVSANTELEADSGPFRIGACVEVEGDENGRGTIIAEEIETEPVSNCGGDNDDVELVGRIHKAPPGNGIGLWVVDGQRVLVLSHTRGRPSFGNFVVGACVEIDGVRERDSIHATRARTVSPYECPPLEELGRNFFGIVQSMDDLGFGGIWTIGGIPVLVYSTTDIDEFVDDLTIGSCVEVTGRSYADIAYQARRLRVTLPRDCQGSTRPGGPVIDRRGIVNAASLDSGSVAPGSLIDIRGKHLSAKTLLPDTPALSLAGTSVTLIDSSGTSFPLRLWYASPNLLEVAIDSEASLGTGKLVVETLRGLAEARITLTGTAPGLFSANLDGEGPAAAMYWRVNIFGQWSNDFTYTDAPEGARRNVTIPFSEGSEIVLALWGTGFRAGANAACTVGGMPLIIRYIGEVPTATGLSQINLGPAPEELRGAGEAKVQCRIEGKLTNTVTVKFGR